MVWVEVVGLVVDVEVIVVVVVGVVAELIHGCARQGPVVVVGMALRGDPFGSEQQRKMKRHPSSLDI